MRSITHIEDSQGRRQPLEDMVERALHVLAKTAISHGHVKARAEAAKHKLKRARGLAFLDAEGSSIKEREAKADASQVVLDAIEELENAIADEQLMRDQRFTAEMYIEMYRTMSANERAANVT